MILFYKVKSNVTRATVSKHEAFWLKA